MNTLAVRPHAWILVATVLFLGSVLAGWSLSTASRAPDEVQPMPPEVRRRLKPYFPVLVLRSVRFQVSRGVEPRVAPRCSTVVFRDAEAARDAVAWARHLVRVTRCVRQGDKESGSGLPDEEADRYAADVAGRLEERYRYF